MFAAFAVKIQVGETAYAAPTEELKTEVSAQSGEVSAQNAESLAAAWNAAVQESLDGNGKLNFVFIYISSFLKSFLNFAFAHKNPLFAAYCGGNPRGLNIEGQEAVEYGNVIEVDGGTLEIFGTTGKITCLPLPSKLSCTAEFQAAAKLSAFCADTSPD